MLDVLCLDCGILHWIAEKYVSSNQCNPTFRICCYEGQVHLLALKAPPEPLHTLLSSNNHELKSFWEDIWKYNHALAFTLLGMNKDHSINCGCTQPVFQICEELCHRSGALVPSGDKPLQYAQLYIYESQAALQSQMAQNQSLSEIIMHGLQDMLLQHHQYVPVLKYAHEILHEYDAQFKM